MARRRQTRLGELAVTGGHITPAQLEEAVTTIEKSNRNGARALGLELQTRGWISGETLDKLLSALEDRESGPPPSRLGPYLVEKEIGRGGMAVVYLARHVELDRPVALKLLRELDQGSSALVERFHREALAVAKLHHPNIVTVHDAGRIDGRPFLAMALIEGPSLAQVFADRKPPLRERILLLVKVADALHHAHAQGIAHRDLKPSNILVDASGEPQLVDFGLAQFTQATRGFTSPGTAMGTPQYMSPEQVRGEVNASGPASDIYSLGAILYEAVTDRLPFSAESVEALYPKILLEEPTPPRSVKKDVPEDLETICLKCLEKEPARRYATAAEVASDLRHWLSQEPISAHPQSIFFRISRFVARRKPVLGTIAGGLLLAAAVAAITIPRWREETRAKKEKERALALQEEARPFLDSGRRLLSRIDKLQMLADWKEDEVHDLADHARSEFSKALEISPNHPEALLEIARSWRVEGDEAKALEYYSRAIQSAPSLVPACLERAFLNLERYERMRHDSRGGGVRSETESARALRQVIDADLSAVRSWSKERKDLDGAEGMFLFADGRYEEAARKLQDFAESTSSDARLWAWTGHAWYHVRGKEAEAIFAFTQSLKFRPRQSIVLYMRGLARQESGDVEGADADFDDASRINRNNADAYRHRGMTLQLKGDRPGAIEAFTRAIEADPSDWESYLGRGIVRRQEGYADGAISDFTKSAELKPTAAAFINRGAVYAERQDYDQAVADFTRALEVDPSNATAYYDRGEARLAKEDYAGAQGDFTQAIKLNPRSVQALNRRGFARQHLGDPDGALADYEEVLRIDPRNADAYHERGHVRQAKGETLEAIHDFERALEFAPPGWSQRAHVETVLRQIRP